MEFLAFLGLVLLVVIFTKGYIKAPPDTAYIISGPFSTRILIGKAGILIPFVERVDAVCLGQVSVDIKTEQSVPTNDFINVNVDAVAKIRVIDSPEGIRLAARNFLNKGLDEIAADLIDSLQGNMREIIGTLSLEEINTNRDAFSDQVMNKAQSDMAKIGIEVLTCNIQNVTDEHGLIQDLGADNTAKIRKTASIAKANSERDVKIAQAQAEKAANDERVKADMEIAQRQNELHIKKQELKRLEDIKRAEADAAYSIQEQEQNKAIQKATVEAEIAKATAEAELKEKEAIVRKNALDADIRRQAEADKYAIEQNAAAQLEKQKREAEALAYAREQEAEAKKKVADAELYSMMKEADGIRAKGEAEAAAIKAKGEAEAAAMDKKAEAYAKYNKAAIAEMLIRVMPEVAGKIAEPIAQIDKVTVITGGNGNGIGSVADTTPLVMSKLFATMKEATGIDLGEIVRAESYDAKVTKNVNLSGLSPKQKEAVSDFVSADDVDPLFEDVVTPMDSATEDTPNQTS